MHPAPTQPPTIEPTKEEKELDRRVIAAVVHADQALFSELNREGLSVEDVNARAARLGVTTELLKRCRLSGTLPQRRKCIKCDLPFLSVGPQNRLCKRCPPG